MADFKFLLLAPDEIEGAFYDEVVPRLKAFSAKTGESVNFDHVYFQLISGVFSLGVVTKDAKIIGIAITSKVADALTGFVGIHVVFVHADKGYDMTAYFAEIWDDMAKHFGYAFVSANLARKGFLKRAPEDWDTSIIFAEKRYV